MAARNRQMQRELEERTREERARAEAEQVALREEQARLRETTLQSELAAATEKGRRVRLFRWGMAAALLLFAFAAVAAWMARQESTRANKEAAAARAEQARAEGAEKVARQRREDAEEKAKQSEQTVKSIEQELTKLRRAALAAPADSALRQTITEAGDSIAKGVNALLSPRVYIHIAREAQRDGAKRLARRLAGARLGDATILVPGVEVKDYAGPSELRCFAADECQRYGKPLLANHQRRAVRVGAAAVGPEQELLCTGASGRCSSRSGSPQGRSHWPARSRAPTSAGERRPGSGLG